MAKLLSAIENMERTPKKAEAIAKKFVNTQKMASEHHFISLVQTSTGVDVKQFLAGNAFVAKETERLTSQNAKLITALHHDLIEQIKASVTQSAMAGGLSKDLAKAIQERAKVGESRARLIARDQKAKVNAAIDRANQEACGVQKYIWSSSKDERVRDRHAELDGQVFEWKTPVPIAGYPAQEVNCRCVAIPVFSKMIEAIQPKPMNPLLNIVGSDERSSIDEAMAFSQSHQAIFHQAGLTQEQASYLVFYTIATKYVENLNRALRKAGETGKLAPKLAYFAKTVDNALEKLPNHEETTYRGILIAKKDMPAFKKRYKVGEVVTEYQFTSTSKEQASSFRGNVKFVIKGKTGKDIEDMSYHKNEKEVLFGTKKQFGVTDVIEQDGILIIKLEEVE